MSDLVESLLMDKIEKLEKRAAMLEIRVLNLEHSIELFQQMIERLQWKDMPLRALHRAL